MNNQEIINKIIKLRKEKNAIILAHNYQIPEIQDLADFVGDSLELAKKSTELKNDLIVFCGVDFMAETTKILNPTKTVLHPSIEAACPMAEMLSEKELIKTQKKHPDAGTVVYVNSSAKAKALSDSVCTSANADNIVNALPQEKILFGPDSNLAFFAQQKSSKEIIPVPEHGFCYVHNFISLENLKQAIKKYPNAKIIVHPECLPEIQLKADFVESTSGMLKKVKELPNNQFLIGTEIGILHRMKKENPEKEFFPIKEDAVCTQMKKISLKNLLNCLEKEEQKIEVDEELSKKAIKAINKMLELGK